MKEGESRRGLCEGEEEEQGRKREKRKGERGKEGDSFHLPVRSAHGHNSWDEDKQNSGAQMSFHQHGPTTAFL